MSSLPADPIKKALDNRNVQELARALAERFGTNAHGATGQLWIYRAAVCGRPAS